MRFTKMHGAGNDFVVLDLRNGAPAPDASQCRLLADRRRGVGCDQVLTIGAPTSKESLASYAIWNADGSAAGQCGNGARCVAAFLVRDGSAQRRRFSIDSPVGTHAVELLPGDEFRVAMGRPDFSPAAIPLREGTAESGIYAEPLDGVGLVAFGAVSMGNPHAVIEVEDVERAEVSRVGWALQRSGMFPESVNVGFAQVRSPRRIDLRVYERGAGETLACGSGACAAAAVLMRRGRVVREVAVALRGGMLRIQWPDESAPMMMSGPAAFVFDGELAG